MILDESDPRSVGSSALANTYRSWLKHREVVFAGPSSHAIAEAFKQWSRPCGVGYPPASVSSSRSLAGALTGGLLAFVSLDSLVALVPLSLPANSPVQINATVLVFALGLAVVTALLFGLVPAIKLSRPPKMISTMLAIGGRSGAPLSKRGGQWLISVEVTLTLVLLAGSGLLLRSFAKLISVDLGYDPDNVLTLEVEPLERIQCSSTADGE